MHRKNKVFVRIPALAGKKNKKGHYSPHLKSTQDLPVFTISTSAFDKLPLGLQVLTVSLQSPPKTCPCLFFLPYPALLSIDCFWDVYDYYVGCALFIIACTAKLKQGVGLYSDLFSVSSVCSGLLSQPKNWQTINFELICPLSLNTTWPSCMSWLDIILFDSSGSVIDENSLVKHYVIYK